MPHTFHTIGHSTRSSAELLQMLRENRVRHLVDVRRFPASRRHPHFNQEPLAHALGESGIEYTHEAALGGRRPARKASPNTGWEEEAFRGYADYMDSRDFEDALTRLEMYAKLGGVCLMCAEAVYWRCHRKLIADALLVRGHTVLHIMAPGNVQPHALTAFAEVLPGGGLRYPEPQQELELEE